MHARLVPARVDNETFWARFFFALKQQHEQEQALDAARGSTAVHGSPRSAEKAGPSPAKASPSPSKVEPGSGREHSASINTGKSPAVGPRNAFPAQAFYDNEEDMYEL